MPSTPSGNHDDERQNDGQPHLNHDHLPSADSEEQIPEVPPRSPRRPFAAKSMEQPEGTGTGQWSNKSVRSPKWNSEEHPDDT